LQFWDYVNAGLDTTEIRMIAMVLTTFLAFITLLTNRIKARVICVTCATFLAICVTFVAVNRAIIGAARLVTYII
jgi:hypothetical protein